LSFQISDGKGNSVQQTKDGDYIITGSIDTTQGNERDVYLIKTDSNGVKVWERTFGDVGWDEGHSVQQTEDGGYIITGTTWTEDNGEDVYLVKTDPNGNMEWEESFGDECNDESRSVQQTKDNGYIIVGHRSCPWTGNIPGKDNVYLIKVIPGPDLYVDADATGTNNGSSWEDAYTYLQDALNAAVPGNVIWVAKGVYKPDQDTNYPAGRGGWISVAAGDRHTVAIRSDGTLWAWGWNNYGQLGDGTTIDQYSPKKIGTDNDWISAAAGEYHTFALKSDGSLWAWGSNAYGQLGDGTTIDQYSPKKIGTDNDWISAAAGTWHTVALKSDGRLWACGYNQFGQLGDGTTTDQYSPKKIGTDNDWISVAAGAHHTLALKSDGSLWAWGYNRFGQLGDDTTTDQYSPKKIGTDNDWIFAAAGLFHTIALKSDGSLWVWGYNRFGQLGDGTTIDQYSPKKIRDRTATFQIKSGMSIYGGYAGYGADCPYTRDIQAYETILSGDLNGDDVEITNPSLLLQEPTRGENSYNVVTIYGTDETCILDGFTIRGGNGSSGGGIIIRYSSATLTNCRFIGNSAGGGGGGGIYNYSSDTNLINCTFNRNFTGWMGGGMQNQSSSPTLTNCTFIGNIAKAGGGMWNWDSSPRLVNCIFRSNLAQVGGGMWNWDSSPTLTNCIFRGNQAIEDLFTGFGGGMYNGSSSPTLTNCTFIGNGARLGGGMCNLYGSNPTLVNCILWGNSDQGGSDESAQILDESPLINYCCVQGWTGSLGGEGNIGDDPLFVDAAGPDDNLRLSASSPCIDAGDNMAVPVDVTTDLDDNPRFVDDPSKADTGNGTPPIVDMGAYEYQSAGYTPSGSYVVVQPVDETTGEQPVTVTFNEVTVAGMTSLATSDSGPTPPTGFKLGEPPTYYDLTTTATPSGFITVCIDYSGITFFGNEEDLRLYHHESGVWVDVTVLPVDTENNMIYGTVTSLSQFAIFEPENQPPVANAGPDRAVSAGDDCTATLALYGTGSSDPDEDALTYNWSGSFGTATGSNPQITLPKGTHTITLMVNDGRGGTDSDTVLITVNDTTPPLITNVPGPIEAEQTSHAGADVEVPLPTVTDNCGWFDLQTDAPDIFPLGTTTVMFKATDEAENTATATTTVTVVDTTPPEITCPSDITIECTGAEGTPVELGSPTVSDICDPDPAVSNDAPAVFPLGETAVTWKAADASGNSSACTQTVTVVDTTPPVLTVPGDVTAEQAETAGTVVPLTATATDLCDVSVEITSDALPIYPVGHTTVTFTATDDCGNSSSASMTVTVQGPPDIKENVKDCLSYYVHESRRISDAIKKIDMSLHARYWLDDTHLDCRQGYKVFHGEYDAVKELMDLFKGKPWYDDDDNDRWKWKKDRLSDEALACAQISIERLVRVDRILAETFLIEIDGVIAVDPSRQKKVDREIDKAFQELAKGDVAWEAGNPDKAIKHYEKAWKHTCRAEREATKTWRDKDKDDNDRDEDEDEDEYDDD